MILLIHEKAKDTYNSKRIIPITSIGAKYIEKFFALKEQYNLQSFSPVIINDDGSESILKQKKREFAYNRCIKETSARYKLDWLLIKAIIKKESNFDKNAVGYIGEIGLMQITPAALRDWERHKKMRYHFKSELFRPELNIEIGTWYFKWSEKQWKKKNKDAIIYALAQYNAGRTNLLKWIKKNPKDKNIMQIIAFPSTKNYVKDILK